MPLTRAQAAEEVEQPQELEAVPSWMGLLMKKMDSIEKNGIDQTRLINDQSMQINSVSNQLAEYELRVNNKIDELEKEQNLNKVEVNNKISQLHEQIEAMKTSLDQKVKSSEDEILGRINDNMRQLELRTKNMSGAMPTYVNSCNYTYDRKAAPKFNGRELNPKYDLLKIIKFINENGPDFHLKGEWKIVANILSSCLTDAAAIWFETIQDQLTCWNDFEEQFLTVYYNQDVQFRLRHSLETGKYYSGGRQNIVEYFQERYNTARIVLVNTSEYERIRILGNHFSDEIQTAMIIQNVDTYTKMLSLLQKMNNKTFYNKVPKVDNFKYGRNYDQNKRFGNESTANRQYDSRNQTSNQPTTKRYYQNERPKQISAISEEKVSDANQTRSEPLNG